MMHQPFSYFDVRPGISGLWMNGLDDCPYHVLDFCAPAFGHPPAALSYPLFKAMLDDLIEYHRLKAAEMMFACDNGSD